MKNIPGPGRILRPLVIVPAVTVTPRPLEDPHHPIRERCCDDCGAPTHPVMMSCKDRTCPTCRAKWYGQHYKALLDFVSGWKDIRFLTLTERNIADLDFRKSHIVQLRGWFGELRRRFKEIEGGVYGVQATNRGRGWHPHLHILFDGSFVLEDQVRDAWREITKGSFEIKLERVTDPGKAVGYLLSDFLQAPKIRPEDVAVYNEVFRGSRLLQTFGKYKGHRFIIPRLKFKCPKCGCEKSTDRDSWLRAAEVRAMSFSGDNSPP